MALELLQPFPPHNLRGMSDNAGMIDQHRVWEAWARADPLWAILSDPSRRGGKWDPIEFFASGVADVELLLQQLEARSIPVNRGRALDFGCGVGRVTQALADQFDSCDGVDISETMIELARAHNRHGDHCRYHVNQAPDLALFDDATFDFVFSTIALQHNPPDVAERYIGEFLRVLSPTGVAVFDMTANLTGSALPAESHRAELRITKASRAVTPTGRGTVVIDVRNTSGVNWPARSRLAVANHWRARDGSMLVQDDGRTFLRHGLASGSTQTVRLQITAPPVPDDYQLEIDLVEEGTCWFADRGSATTSARIRVRRSLAARLSETVKSLLQGNDVRRLAPTSDEPSPFEMHGLPRDRVEQAVGAGGGTIVDVLANDSGGDNWDAYRYFVVKPERL
jgi:SAM-dependent methyltransferase